MLLLLAALLGAILLPSSTNAQTISVSPDALADSTTSTAAITRLATQALRVYRDSNELSQLDQHFRLQLLAGHPAEAAATLARFRKAQAARGDTTPASRGLNAQYEIYLRAKQLQSDSALAFADAFARVLRERFARLDDRTAGAVARALSCGPLPGDYCVMRVAETADPRMPRIK